MPRPDRSAERRESLLPVVAGTFAELGYRRTSTAVLAERCGVRVNVLYRLWPDKQAMFVAAIEHVFARSLTTWERRLAGIDRDRSPARSLLHYEARHLGEHGLYRVLFDALGETDEAPIRSALAATYGRFVAFIREQVSAHAAHATAPDATPVSGGTPRPDGEAPLTGTPSRGQPAERDADDLELRVWAILGLGTVATIGRELGLLPADARARLLEEIGGRLLSDRASAGDPLNASGGS